MSQSPIQRGWLCGTANRGTANGSALSQSPIQRGWLCGPADKTDDGVVQPWASQSPIQRGWLCGSTSPVFMCLGLAGVSIPYPAGMALWLHKPRVHVPRPSRSLNPLSSGDGFVARPSRRQLALVPLGLNPLSSGDGFVAEPKTLPAEEPQVSIPYPAGMALWRPGRCGHVHRQPRVSQSPIQRGWLCGWKRRYGRCKNLVTVSIPYPAGMALWLPGKAGRGQEGRGLNPLSSGDGFVARRPPIPGPPGLVSIPYPAGMALWLPGKAGRGQEGRGLNPLSSGDGFVAKEEKRNKPPFF